jgi:hypothetical protein
MMRAAALLVPIVVAASLPCQASDFGNLGALAQQEFRDLSTDLGAAFAYKGVAPATALGILGFDIGIEATDTKMEHSRLFSLAGSGGQSHLFVPKLHVHKGLFAGFDIGAFIAGTPDIDATAWGADMRYTFVDDGLTTPAVGVRLSGSRTSGMGSLKVGTAAVDLMVSKKFALLTPYLGAGAVRIASSASGFNDERIDQGRVFGGVNLNLALINFAFEVEKLGDNTSLSAKLGWRF